jgi:hypothetical protein
LIADLLKRFQIIPPQRLRRRYERDGIEKTEAELKAECEKNLPTVTRTRDAVEANLAASLRSGLIGKTTLVTDVNLAPKWALRNLERI